MRLLHAEITDAVIGAFFEVYNELGFGLLEAVYSAAMADELRTRRRHVQREQWVDVYYKRRPVARQRIDMIVDQRVVVEIKATEVLPRLSQRQLLTYLTVTHLEIGLLALHPSRSAIALTERQQWPEDMRLRTTALA